MEGAFHGANGVADQLARFAKIQRQSSMLFELPPMAVAPKLIHDVMGVFIVSPSTWANPVNRSFHLTSKGLGTCRCLPVAN